MIATLGALFETITVLAGASALASLAVGPLLAGVRRFQVAPAIRADLVLAIAALPAGTVVVVAIAVAVPGALDLLGLVRDHCGEHGGHGHLCLVHPEVAVPAMVALGSLALAATALRTGRWLAARIVAARNLGKLLRLGEPSAEGPDIVCVDGSAILCHATGGWNPCVLVSTQLLSKISPELLSAALDHERAHLKRRDVLTRDLLSVLGLLAWPGIGNITVDAWEEAAEEAADAAAAMRHGGHTVARALVAVARLSLTPKPATMPIIGAGVTRRVHALLNGPPTHWPALALGLVPITGLVLVGVAAIHADPLHHVVESVLYFILGA